MNINFWQKEKKMEKNWKNQKIQNPGSNIHNFPPWSPDSELPLICMKSVLNNEEIKPYYMCFVQRCD